MQHHNDEIILIAMQADRSTRPVMKNCQKRCKYTKLGYAACVLRSCTAQGVQCNCTLYNEGRLYERSDGIPDTFTRKTDLGIKRSRRAMLDETVGKTENSDVRRLPSCPLTE